MNNDQAKIKNLNIRELLAYELPLSKSLEISDEKISPINHLPFSTTYIKAIHRRLECQERYILPITRYKIIFFGQPILIPYSSEDKITNEHIYKLVYKQLERLIRQNNDLTTSLSNHEFNCDHSSRERYQFLLKHVNEDGKKCSICSWNR